MALSSPLLYAVVCLSTLAGLTSNLVQSAALPEASDAGPVVLGHGVGLFQIGELLTQDNFENLNHWEVQIQQRSGFPTAHVVAKDNSLDCLVPGRGCTVWFKQKLPTRITITYDVLCPTSQPAIKGVQPRDINNFWMASDPAAPAESLFDSTRYTGAFGSYDKIHGYYASTGGGGAEASNLTTRMRRYPREVDGKPAEHLALTDKDKKTDYLITPDKVMTVQSVAYDDVVQYIVDGKLVYQIGRDDKVQMEGRDSEGQPIASEAVYDLNRFPVYREGYFGFRMVGTHHIYTNFKVHTLQAQTVVEVSTLSELREAAQKSNQTIVMKSGNYSLTDLPDGSRDLPCSGSNNTIDLSGTHITVPVGTTRRSYITLSGNNNIFRGGTFEDIYQNGLSEVTDFSVYNQNRSTLAKGLSGSAVLTITGDNNTVADTKLTIRGSFPYGYGSIYGIGSDNVYGLDKRCGILVKGKRNTIDGCNLQQRAFGHGIYMQSPADETVIKNCLVEGALRPSKDLYLETDAKDLPVRSNYKIPGNRDRNGSSNRGANRREIASGNENENDGTPIPKDAMIPLSEDGIRVYTNGGSVTVENCTVKKMRGGIRLYLASRASVINSTAVDCGFTNFNMPPNGKIIGSTGNFAYAPLSDFRLSRSGQDLELTILPSPHRLGAHNLADVLGNNHNLVFHRTDGPLDTNLCPIVVAGNGSTIRNETEYPIILQSSASGNTVFSIGPVTDLGNNNMVSRSFDE